jgi:hypothetical protein
VSSTNKRFIMNERRIRREVISIKPTTTTTRCAHILHVRFESRLCYSLSYRAHSREYVLPYFIMFYTLREYNMCTVVTVYRGTNHNNEFMRPVGQSTHTSDRPLLLRFAWTRVHAHGYRIFSQMMMMMLEPPSIISCSLYVTTIRHKQCVCVATATNQDD